MTEIICATDVRRSLVRRQRLFGIDSVEPNDDGTLTVTFLGKAPRDDRDRISHRNIRIDGGRRITGLRAVGVDMRAEDDPELDDRMIVQVDRTGDGSEYTLCVVAEGPDGRPGTAPFPGFDPRYHCAPFGFRAGGPADEDCAPDGCAGAPVCPPSDTGRPRPVIDYTARDYDSLLRMLLDRMSLTVPAWTERHAPDLGVTLAELLAYTGDQLSYAQDAVGTEAYLTTARRRVSVRRHVRLIDYAMHDGCNARAFVTIEVAEDVSLPHGGYRFVAVDVSDLPPQEQPVLAPVIADEQLRALPPGTTHEVFEPLGDRAQSADLHLHRAHNTIGFWTWGNEDCRLPKGATSATLRDPGRELRLRPGDVLVIEEVTGPRTGTPADADPAHRQAVRLTSVTPGEDTLLEQPIVEVTWAQQDALTFDACLSAHGGPDRGLLTDVSVARGNVVLADHGQSRSFCAYPPETFAVPHAPITAPACGCPGEPEQSPATELVHALLAGARAGRTVTPAEVSEVTGLVGSAAVTRAGLSADDSLSDQVAELETLLAQLTYPRVPATFRPVLSGAPVTQCASYPSPRLVSAGQAAVLGGLADRVRDRVHELWRSVSAGDELSAEAAGELETIFGRRALDRARLDDDPERALRELLARFGELLAVKLERLATLTARAAAGTVLGTSLVWEIGHTWGRRHMTGLDPEDPVLAGPAAASLAQDPRAALPAVRADGYDSILPGRPADSARLAGTWLPARDLLTAGPRDRLFVGELGDDGRLALRFGTGIHGAAPPAGGELRVFYRVGNGTAGNVGAAAINHLVLCGGDELPEVRAVRNPMPAVGGTDPESVSDVRQLAPLAPRATQLRAVTAVDYARLAAGVAGVLRAAADIRWTGSGEEVHVAVQPAGPVFADRSAGPEVPNEALMAAVTAALAPFRRIGHGLVVGAPALVPLDIELEVLIEPGYPRRDVLAALHRVFGTGLLPGGAPAFFNPRALGFGEPVRVSRLVAAAVGVPGVTSARVRRLKRLAGPDEGELAAGLLRIGPLAVAVCDSSPGQPEKGRVSIVAGGGR